jgi:methionyl-tRNA formyltransferase
MLMDEKMDHGPILAQKECHVDPHETLSSLEDKTANIGIPLLIHTLQQWFAGTITPQKQNHEHATYTRMLKKESGNIDWSKSAQEIERMVRALNPWPGTWTQWRTKRVKIVEAHANSPVASPIKENDIFFAHDERLFARCGANENIEITKIQMEGKNAVTGTAFIHGYLH